MSHGQHFLNANVILQTCRSQTDRMSSQKTYEHSDFMWLVTQLFHFVVEFFIIKI